MNVAKGRISTHTKWLTKSTAAGYEVEASRRLVLQRSTLGGAATLDPEWRLSQIAVGGLRKGTC